MDIFEIQKRMEERKKEKKKNAVADLLSDFQKSYADNNLVDAIQLRRHEIDSFIAVIHAAMEANDCDESFYRKRVASAMYLLEERYDEFQVLIEALIDEHLENKTVSKVKVVA